MNTGATAATPGTRPPSGVLVALIVGQICLHSCMAGVRMAAPLQALKVARGVFFDLEQLAIREHRAPRRAAVGRQAFTAFGVTRKRHRRYLAHDRCLNCGRCWRGHFYNRWRGRRDWRLHWRGYHDRRRRCWRWCGRSRARGKRKQQRAGENGASAERR